MKLNSFATVGKKLFIVGPIVDGAATVRTSKGKEDKVKVSELTLLDAAQSELVIKTFHEKEMEIPWFPVAVVPPAPEVVELPIPAEIPVVVEKQIEVVKVAQIPRSPRLVAPSAPVESEEQEEEQEETNEPAESTPCDKIPTIDIMGQTRASNLLNGFLSDFGKSGEFPASIVIAAPPGTGKSHAFNVFARALETAGKQLNVLEIESGSEFARLDSDATTDFIQALKYTAKGVHTVIKVDEAHLLKDCGKATKRIFDALIYGSGQGWKRRGSVPFGGKMVNYDTRFLTLVFITNFPDKIMKGNVSALKRRFLFIELEKYSPEIMRKITVSYFKEKGITVEPEALKHLVKMHRGTLVALDDFRTKANGRHNGTITEEVVSRVLPDCDFTLRGFKRDEAEALKWLSETKEPTTRGNLIQNFPTLDVSEFYRHCVGQETKSKEGAVRTPFLEMERNEYRLTSVGKVFLTKNKEALSI